MRKILYAALILVGASGTSWMAYNYGYARAVDQMRDAVNYDHYRELAVDAHFVAIGREDIYFRGVNSVMMLYPDFIQIEQRLGISDEQKRISERLMIQYFYSRNQSVPRDFLPLIKRVPKREEFEKNKLPSRERIEELNKSEWKPSQSLEAAPASVTPAARQPARQP